MRSPRRFPRQKIALLGLAVVVYGSILFLFLGGTRTLPVGSLEGYETLADSVFAILLVLPVAVFYLLRKRSVAGTAVALVLMLELVFFLAVPAIPMVESGTTNGSTSWVAYGSVSYVHSCIGATVNVQTQPATTLPQISEYATAYGCLFA
jgi:hypothetical protein